MFTGIIEEIGTIESVSSDTLKVKCFKILDDIKLGDSVAVNGVCLSVTKILPNLLWFNTSPTTTQLANFLGRVSTGDHKVNLERALKLSDRLGGHMVTGHIDGQARLINITPQGSFNRVEFQIPPAFRSLIVKKGSVALDGVSLTVADVFSSSFIVSVIPQTLQDSTLSLRRVGNFVNFEVDVFARYVQSMLNSSPE